MLAILKLAIVTDSNSSFLHPRVKVNQAWSSEDITLSSSCGVKRETKSTIRNGLPFEAATELVLVVRRKTSACRSYIYYIYSLSIQVIALGHIIYN